MNNTELNLAIAEACGWKIEKTDEGGKLIWPNGFAVEFCPYNYALEMFKKKIPSYASDLNAMHEAESTLPAGVLDVTYISVLAHVCGFAMHGPEAWDELVQGRCQVVRATAAQRAEAYAKVRGIWVE